MGIHLEQGSRLQPGSAAPFPIVQAGLLRPLLRYADDRGADTGALLRRADLPPDLEAKPQHFVPAAGWFDLFTAVARESGEADIGWRVAGAAGLSAYSTEFVAFSRAPTLLEAWRYIVRVQSKHDNCQFFQMRVIGDFAYVIQGDTFLSPGFEQRNAFRIANSIAVIRVFLGEDWLPDLLVTQTPLGVLPRTALAGVRVVQRKRYSAIRIPRAQLTMPPRQAPRGGYHQGPSAPPDLAGQIKQVLRSYPPGQRPGTRELAALMNTSARSLQRRLHAQSTSYSRLVREATFENAQVLLADQTLTITEIAHGLGYSDSSHFSRLFRSLGGVSPVEYRAGLRDGRYPSPGA